MNIKRHEIQQLFVRQFGELQFRAAFEHVLDETLLGFDQLIDFILDGAATDKFMHEDIPGLPDPECAIGGLVLHRRIPPAIEMHHMRGGGEIQARTTGFERQDENWVNTSIFSCFAAMTSAISRSRANLPLSASAHAAPPSHCDA